MAELNRGGSRQFVSRSGQKLAFALTHFGLDPRGWLCADLGSHVGGFVDCLLWRGAARVYSIDTSYGTLAWKLRRDPRVVVLERTNALHLRLPEPVDLVTIDVGWTPQRLILAQARTLLKAGGRILTLIKPHYEAPPALLKGGVLEAAHHADVLANVCRDIQALDLQILGQVDSPITGHGGNREVLALLTAGP